MSEEKAFALVNTTTHPFTEVFISHTAVSTSSLSHYKLKVVKVNILESLEIPKEVFDGYESIAIMIEVHESLSNGVEVISEFLSDLLFYLG
jgi:hypothetical protein